MSYYGDIRLGDTIDIKFTTRQISGAPFTLAGTPVISAYVGNGTTEITAGITLTVDFDSRTGLNNVRVVASSGNGFATATNVELVITTGTVNSVSVVGEVIGSFSIENRSAVMPTTAARTLDVSATGEAGLDWANIGSPTTAVNLSATNIDVDQVVASVSGAVGSVTGAVASVTGAVGSVTAVSSGAITEASFATTAGSFAPLGIVDQGTAQSATGTTIVLRAAAAFANDEILGAVIYIISATAGAGQVRTITDYVSSTDTATVDTWTTTPTGTIVYKIFAAPPISATYVPTVNVAQVAGQTASAAGAVTFPGTIASATNITAGTITTVTNLTNAPTAGDLTATMKTSVTTAATAATPTASAVTGAVGSVTGNVGGNVTGSVGSLATQAKADVNAEVVDALATDTYAEPGQGTPAATATLAAKINYLYKAWRNKKTQTSSAMNLFADDATTVDQKAAVSDDGTTTTVGEIATGP